MSKQPPDDVLKKGTGSEPAGVSPVENSGTEVPVPLFQPGQPTFEQSLERLEGIVHALEEGKLGLNESLERYEEGVKLLRQSYELLQRAERKIELLSGVDAEGNPVTQPFDDTATIDEEESGKRRSRRRSAVSKPPERGDGGP
jgi:exodeoxyribonuclease VII small subunit